MEARTADGWQEIARETTVGCKRIVLLPRTEASQIRINVTESLAQPLLSGIGLYDDPIYHE